MRRHWAIIAWVAALLASMPVSADIVGNGGDAYSREFVSTAYEVLSRLTTSPVAEIDNSSLARAILSTQVNSQESLELDGFPVDAINYAAPGAPRIVLSRVGWDRLRGDSFARSALVLHEYLGIMGVDDRHYQISHLIDQARVCSRAKEIRAEIEKFFSLSCDRLLPQDLMKIESLGIDGLSVERLAPDDLRYLTGLTSLRIDSDRLEDWSEATFAGIPIKYLHLTLSASAKLESRHFRHLDGLEELQIRSKISSVAPGTFRRQNRLARLFFEDVSTPLSVGAFEGLASLKELWLQGSEEPVVLEKGLLSDLRNLSDFRVHGLENAPPGFFNGPAEVENVRIGFRDYEAILARNPGFLAELKGTRYLELGGGGIEKARRSDFDAFYRLDRLYIAQGVSDYAQFTSNPLPGTDCYRDWNQYSPGLLCH